MARLGLEKEIHSPQVHARTVPRFREAKSALPTFAEVADPKSIPTGIQKELATVDPDAPHPANLFRVHWYNDDSRRAVTAVPRYVALPPELTGAPARILVAFG